MQEHSPFQLAAAQLAEARSVADAGWAEAEFVSAERSGPGLAEFRSVRVLAEGDSWMDYPGNDIADCLDDHGYDVLRIARKGHLVEDIAHTQLGDLLRAFAKHRPRFVVVSGGGNDIAGSELAMMVNHRLSRLAMGGERLRPGVVRYIFDHVIHDAYVRVLETAFAAADEYGTGPLDILGHGYDYPFADGRAAFLFFGPWLKPALVRRGYDDPDERRALVKDLIDEMNALQAKLAGAYEHYHYLDLRGTLPRPQDWSNELHPSQRQFGYLAQRFSETMQQLLA